jgi:predicted hydrocarbon binding protein
MTTDAHKLLEHKVFDDQTIDRHIETLRQVLIHVLIRLDSKTDFTKETAAYEAGYRKGVGARHISSLEGLEEINKDLAETRRIIAEQEKDRMFNLGRYYTFKEIANNLEDTRVFLKSQGLY